MLLIGCGVTDHHISEFMELYVGSVCYYKDTFWILTNFCYITEPDSNSHFLDHSVGKHMPYNLNDCHLPFFITFP